MRTAFSMELPTLFGRVEGKKHHQKHRKKVDEAQQKKTTLEMKEDCSVGRDSFHQSIVQFQQTTQQNPETMQLILQIQQMKINPQSTQCMEEPSARIHAAGSSLNAIKVRKAEWKAYVEKTPLVCPVTGSRSDTGVCPMSFGKASKGDQVGMCPMGFGRANRGRDLSKPSAIELDLKSQAHAMTDAPSLQVLHSSPGENVDGFLSPKFGLCPSAPIPSLPSDGPHAIWELLANKLPEMYFSGDYSPLEKLPVVDSTLTYLPDKELKRAAMLLGIMAHSWAQVGPGGELPPGVLTPWENVNRRMGRPAATMTYQDYFTLNLCWHDGLATTPTCFTDDNIYKDTEVSIKAFGIDNELFFIQYNFGIDWFSRGMPLDMAKAQQAVLDNDDATLEEMLLKIIHHVESMTTAFTAIDPHPFSSKYCCPIEWSKTIGKIIPSIRKGEQSLSGLQNSSIHLVDIFLGRMVYDSDMGKLAIEERQGWLPSLHLQFFQALSKISVRAYVCRHSNRRLHHLYNRLLDAWTGPGEHSWMSKHRIKINNFLELGMKTARDKSSGVSAGEGSDWGNSRAWETVDRYCREAAHERFNELCIKESWFTPVFLRRVEDMPRETSRIVFDVAGSGLCFEPGDRIKVQPMNSPEQVLRCLEALKCAASRKVPLTEEWLQFVARLGLHDILEQQEMPLHDFLQHAIIRPMTLTIARTLMQHMCVDNSCLSAQLNSVGGVSGFEFWDFLLLCSALSTSQESNDLLPVLASILSPMKPRQYSISSAGTVDAQTLEIVVGQLRYPARDIKDLTPDESNDASGTAESSLAAHNSATSCDKNHQKLFAQALKSLSTRPTLAGTIGCPERSRASPQASMDFVRPSSEESVADKEKGPMRFGVGSTYLRHCAIGRSVNVMVERAEHFHMPSDPTVPIVMFGLGTGTAPFRSFIQSAGGTRELWLFWGMRSTADLFDWEEWAKHIVHGELNLRLALSQDFTALQSHQWPDRPTELEAKRRWHELTAGAEVPGRLDTLFEQPSVQQSLADLVHRGAMFYCCGQPALNDVVGSGLVSALQSTGSSMVEAQHHFFKLIGDHRFKLDLFSSQLLEGQHHLPSISRAEVARHCHPNDCWVIIDGKVCDLSKYLLQHPGGPKILLDKAGRDCTQDFDRAHGLHNNRVLGMLSPYVIGPVLANSQDSSHRQICVDVVWELVDRLLEAYHVLRADWNRYPELLLPVGPVTSFHRDKETHRRFVSTTLKVMMRALQTSLKSIPGCCADESIAFSALEISQQALEMIEPPDQVKLASAIDGDFAFAAKARDGAIALLEDLEVSDLEPAEVMRRIDALMADLADASGNLVQSFFRS